jgi:sulfur-oxidizing protein SoxY
LKQKTKQACNQTLPFVLELQHIEDFIAQCFEAVCIQRRTHNMNKRRDVLQWGLASAGVVAMESMSPVDALAYEKSAFEAKTWTDALKVLGSSSPTESKDVVLNAPDIAENGAVVPLSASCALPGVKRIIFLVEKNPTPLCSVFNVSEDILANFSMRTKMGQTSNVYAVAVLGDGRALMAKKEIKVTLGGCGG